MGSSQDDIEFASESASPLQANAQQARGVIGGIKQGKISECEDKAPRPVRGGPIRATALISRIRQELLRSGSQSLVSS